VSAGSLHSVTKTPGNRVVLAILTELAFSMLERWLIPQHLRAR